MHVSVANTTLIVAQILTKKTGIKSEFNLIGIFKREVEPLKSAENLNQKTKKHEVQPLFLARVEPLKSSNERRLSRIKLIFYVARHHAR